MKNRGCLIEETTSIVKGWTYEQTSDKLAEWFPQIFAYVQKHGLDQQYSADRKMLLPWWRLLMKHGSNLAVVETVYPTGEDLIRYKGREKASINDSQIWFGAWLYIYSNVALTRGHVSNKEPYSGRRVQ